jgi:SAM-dependent methyltransferase
MKLLDVHECNVCRGKNIEPVCAFPQFPLVLRPISDAGIAELKSKNISPTLPLRLGICRDCGHFLLLSRPSDDMLQDLYRSLYTTYLSKLELGFATEDADEFVAVFKENIKPRLPAGARILEIGCYDGYLLLQLAKEGFSVLGCDPSEGAKIGEQRGIPIVREFFSPELFDRGSFGAVINRHLIEHLDDPVKFAAAARECVRADGFVAIETPNGAYFVEHNPLGLPCHFEHLSVFTPNSLRVCLERAGLKVERLFDETGNLVALCSIASGRPEISNDRSRVERLVGQAKDFASRFDAYLSQLTSLAEKLNRQGSTLALWGAGSFGITLLTLAPLLAERVTAVVDRDGRKHGLKFLNLDTAVSPPEVLQKNAPDYILVCSQYSAEITRDIRDRYGLSSKVLSLTPKIELLE